MKSYLDLLRQVYLEGATKTDRTGTGTLSIFGAQLRCDLSKGFPLLTTKKVFFKGIVAELLWFLSGSSNIKALQDQGVHIWDDWADENGELGPVYGVQWRSWPSFKIVNSEEEIEHEHGEKTYLSAKVSYTPIDQIKNVVNQIRTNPDSRRLIVSAWNPSQVDYMKLPPCHCLFQFYVADGKLSCQLYQRSADLFLGVPFNIASYALLTHMIAAQTGLGVGDFVWTGGDCHIYANHLEQVEEQLSRTPGELPKLTLRQGVNSIFDYTLDDIALDGYLPQPAIKAPVAV